MSDPVITTLSATMIGKEWATLNGVVNPRNQIAQVTFIYDSTTDYLNPVNGKPVTASGDSNTLVVADLMDLEPATRYFFKIKVEISDEIIYGDSSSFTTTNPVKSIITFNPDLTYGSLQDIDGNIYRTIAIGDQTWMAENLMTTKFNDGAAIPFVKEAAMWSAISTPGYCWYNHDSLSYGGLYNWYAVNAGNLCPSGWHIPTDEEWTTLTSYAGGEEEAGIKLKETGTVHWYSNNDYSSNQTGFTALPGGYRYYYGVFNAIRRYGYWWSSTEASSSVAYCQNLSYSFNNIERSSSIKKSGFSVRCIKD